MLKFIRYYGQNAPRISIVEGNFKASAAQREFPCRMLIFLDSQISMNRCSNWADQEKKDESQWHYNNTENSFHLTDSRRSIFIIVARYNLSTAT
jgi:hypothetical protein